jgi:hypothetical protein
VYWRLSEPQLASLWVARLGWQMIKLLENLHHPTPRAFAQKLEYSVAR